MLDTKPRFTAEEHRPELATEHPAEIRTEEPKQRLVRAPGSGSNQNTKVFKNKTKELAAAAVE
jgi:hypothetical protein